MFETALIILEQALLHLPLLIGAYISISLMKVPDLSIESAYVFGALVSAQTVQILSHTPVALSLTLALVAGLLGGALVGLTSSTLTQQAGLPHLLSSIITFGIFHGINQMINNGYVTLSGYPNVLAAINVIPRYPELPILCIITCILIVSGYFFLKTQLGYACAVYGNNNRFFSYYGISTKYVFMTGIIMSNALAGLSGYLNAQSNGFAQMNMGLGKALLCITGLILAKAVINTKQLMNITIPIIGALSYFAIQQLLLKVGFNLKFFTMIQALIVLIILMYTYKKKSETIDHLGV